MSVPNPTVDVHQHLWPDELVDALRARSHAPYLRDWTLHLDGEAPYDVRSGDHGVEARVRSNSQSGIDTALLSLSSPLGIERLDPAEAGPLTELWNRTAVELAELAPHQLGVWASTSLVEPDLDGLRTALAAGCVGLQVPADALASPTAIEAMAPVLTVAQDAGKPVFVHPGPATKVSGTAPPWWPAVVDYVAQMNAAWWAWHEAGRSLLPDLRVCLGAGAGLAPLHHERLTARGGSFSRIDPDVFVETSSYGPRAVDALTRVLGIDAIVLGTDRPYAEPNDPQPGAAAARAIRVHNPHRLLYGGAPDRGASHDRLGPSTDHTDTHDST